MNDTVTIAVWDVPMPAVAGEPCQVKAGAKSATGRKLAGEQIEVCDAGGAVVASGTLGERPWPGTEALYWAALDVPAPREPSVTEYSVRLAGGNAVATRFSVAATARPEHTLTVTVSEQTTKAALDDVEIRLGPFHARTDKSGHAKLRVCKGDYQLQLWRNAHIAQPTQVVIEGDVAVALAMAHVPEEHPDARWVR